MLKGNQLVGCFITCALLLLSATSCSFNKIILHPEKPPTAKQIVMQGANDTTVVHFGQNGEKVVITHNNNKDTIDPGYTIENVYFRNQNGDTLNGWLLKPSHQTASITLLHLHGNAGYLLSQLSFMSPFAKRGFQVFMFDYSGFGYSKGKASRYNILPNAMAALDYIQTRADVKNTHIVIYGQSLGGHFSTALAAKRQKDINGLVVEGGFTSIKAMASHKVPVIGPLLVKQGYRADKLIKEVHKPVLIIHSTEDHTIPFAMGKKIYENANAPKEFYQIQKPHIYGPVYYGDEIAEKIKKMVQ